MRRFFQACGAVVSASVLLFGCESLWFGHTTPNPDSCEAPGFECPGDQVCNPATRKCEERPVELPDSAVATDDLGGPVFGGSDGGTGGTPLLCSGTLTPACTTTGMFCTQAVLADKPLKRVHATSETDIWAVSSSHLLHYDGKLWQKLSPCTSQGGFVDVFAVTQNDVWVIESRRVIRILNNNASEVPIALPTATTELRAIWGVSGRIWVVGSEGMIQQWDGSKWIAQSSGVTNHLNGVWGPDVQNMWAVGDGGTIVYSNGSVGWTLQSSSTTANLAAIQGRSSTAVWAVGATGTVLQLSGTKWDRVTISPSPNLLGVSVASDDSGWIVSQSGALFRRTAGNWVAHNTTDLLPRPNTDVWSFNSNSASMVGGNTKSVRSKWTGITGTWNDSLDELLPTLRSLGVFTFMTVIGMGQGADNNTYGLGIAPNGVIVRTQIGGAGWVGQAMWVDPAPSGSRLAWVVGKGGQAYGLSSGVWTASGTGVSEDLRAVCGVSSSAVWAAGNDATDTNARVAVFNGISWTALPTNILLGNPLYALACANGQAYAVGKNMQVLDCSGASCLANSLINAEPGQTAHAIWITPSTGSGSDIWVAGTAGKIYRYQTTPKTKQSFTSGTTQTLRHIFGKNNAEFYVTGDGGTVLKWNGTAFSVVKTDSTASVQAGTMLPNGNTAVIGGPAAGWLHQLQ